MTLGLAMLVKDAEETLPRLLASLPPDTDPERSTIFDTGSRDGTMDVVREWGAKPLNTTFVRFDKTRTALMRQAKGKADHLLLLDADMELNWSAPLEPLQADLGIARVIQPPGEYKMAVLAHGQRDWEFRGAAHAVIHPGDGRERVPIQEIASFTVLDHGTTGRSKYLRDIDALWEELRETHFENPRAWYYLGQSYSDLGEKQMAVACFTIRSTTIGMEEERWAAMYRTGLLLIEDNFLAGANLLLQAFQLRPSRAEPLRALAAFSDRFADALPFPDGEVLPIRRDFYGPRQ